LFAYSVAIGNNLLVCFAIQKIEKTTVGFNLYKVQRPCLLLTLDI